MSGRSDDNSGVSMAGGLLLVFVMLVGLVLFAVIGFITFFFTIVSLIALFRPVRLGKYVVEAEEGKTFLKRGLAGAFLVPAFAFFCCVIFGLRIRPEFWNWLVIGGYCLGSLGVSTVEAIEAQNAEEQARTAELLLPPTPAQRAVDAPEGNPSPSRSKSASPFRFASWDDEEELR